MYGAPRAQSRTPPPRQGSSSAMSLERRQATATEDPRAAQASRAVTAAPSPAPAIDLTTARPPGAQRPDHQPSGR
eukprot:11482841-Heterocapsa_arctica.AAC.1